MTIDTCGHLIPDPDEREVLDALAERTGGAPIRTTLGFGHNNQVNM